MPEDDIYGNRKRYERFLASLESLVEPIEEGFKLIGNKRYYCKNPENLKYFKLLVKLFDTRDLSYIRRLRLFDSLRLIVHVVEIDLKECTRGDINNILAFSHEVHKSIESKTDFVNHIRFIWRQLLPEEDERGRPDETILPYPVRHLSLKIDKSKKKLRNDRLTVEEIEQIVSYFSKDVQMQAYITLALESLGRPQEICFRRIKDLELFETYAKILVSDHGKEGTKMLQCIDSFPYLLKWFEIHPYQNDKEAFIFLSNGKSDQPLRPENINKKLRQACKDLKIDKRITGYSLKRNGITLSRLRGDSDVAIQHRAGWTSTKQLKTYDMSTQEDSFRKELAKRGMIQEEQDKDFLPETKQCICGRIVGFSEKMCPYCKRIIDKKVIKEGMRTEEEIKKVFSYAMANPKLSFVEIMDVFRKRETPMSIEVQKPRI